MPNILIRERSASSVWRRSFSSPGKYCNERAKQMQLWSEAADMSACARSSARVVARCESMCKCAARAGRSQAMYTVPSARCGHQLRHEHHRGWRWLSPAEQRQSICGEHEGVGIDRQYSHRPLSAACWVPGTVAARGTHRRWLRTIEQRSVRRHGSEARAAITRYKVGLTTLT